MLKKVVFVLFILIFFVVGVFLYSRKTKNTVFQIVNDAVQPIQSNPLQISYMREQSYPGSDLKIEEILSDGSNYKRYIASYLSDNLKIYGLLTVPKGDKPEGGWPAIIFNHGYIPPSVYRTTERYVAYLDSFARNGYVVFKPDYRGNGNSEGSPDGAYYSPSYTIDVLNALSSVKKYDGVNSEKIGMWGHSMGGNITLRISVVDPNGIKAAVIWGGVVGTYDDLMNNWQRRVTYRPSPDELARRHRFRQDLIDKYGTPQSNPDSWNLLDPNFYLNDVTAPIQLHAGTMDEEVPWEFSQGLYDRLKKTGKDAELFTYEGADHNISQSFNLAAQRSVEFFDKYLKR